MFSIFHGLFTVAAIEIDRHNRNVQTRDNKRRAKKMGALTYYGARGNEYLVENDRWVSTKKNYKGEDVIADMKTGRVYYNLTEIKKKKERKERLLKGKTVRSTVPGEHINNRYGKYKQSWSYIDIETDIPVHCIDVNCMRFYQEVKTGMLLRIADGETCKNKVGNYTNEKIIEIFNKRQKSIEKELEINKDDYIWLERNYFFNSNYSIYIDSKGKFNIFYISYPEGNKKRWEYIYLDEHNYN